MQQEDRRNTLDNGDASFVDHSDSEALSASDLIVGFGESSNSSTPESGLFLYTGQSASTDGSLIFINADQAHGGGEKDKPPDCLHGKAPRTPPALCHFQPVVTYVQYPEPPLSPSPVECSLEVMLKNIQDLMVSETLALEAPSVSHGFWLGLANCIYLAKIGGLHLKRAQSLYNQLCTAGPNILGDPTPTFLRKLLHIF